MSEALFRQRRNLIGTSLIIFVVIFLGINISQFALFGITVKTNSHKILYLLALVHFYFLVRYMQFKNEEDIDFTKTQHGKKLTYIAKNITKQHLQNCPEDFIPDQLGQEGQKEFQQMIKKFEDIVLSKLYEDENTYTFNYNPNEDESIFYSVNKLQLIKFTIVATRESFINTTYFTNYIFPIVVGVVALVYFFASTI